MERKNGAEKKERKEAKKKKLPLKHGAIELSIDEIYDNLRNVNKTHLHNSSRTKAFDTLKW